MLFWLSGIVFVAIPSLRNNTNFDQELDKLMLGEKQIESERVLERPRMESDRLFRAILQDSTATNHSKRAAEYDKEMHELVRTGLVVPRWSGELEVAVHGPTTSYGEMGSAVDIKEEDLEGEQKAVFKKGWEDNAFNQYASDLVSLHRSLPDIRDSECMKHPFQIEGLPDTSIIIIFHNEAWSTLLRTVHSVLDRSHPSLLNQIILVDDFSDKDHLKEPLDAYMAKLKKVVILRGPKRQGLIRARLMGAEIAQGQVLTFLDSHCEVTIGWLEPLLMRIAADKHTVVTPIIDVISDTSLAYHYTSARSTSVGGFDWSMQFNWQPIPEHEKKRRHSVADPIRSPTMAGGLFSIDKDFFNHLGAYDPGMDIWGAENLEMSFKIWMCGGVLEIVVCSHVGHIFRSRSPYKWRSGVNVLVKNTVRLAEVWMDDYKNIYYERINNNLGNFGDVSERKALRQRLGCKSFDWYLHNIYPQQFLPNESLCNGEVRNRAMWHWQDLSNLMHLCLDSATEPNNLKKPLNLWPCHNQGGNQQWFLDKQSRLRRDDFCIGVKKASVVLVECKEEAVNQVWQFTKLRQLRNKSSGDCLAITTSSSSSSSKNKVVMQTCKQSWEGHLNRQLWTMKCKAADTAAADAGVHANVIKQI